MKFTGALSHDLRGQKTLLRGIQVHLSTLLLTSMTKLYAVRYWFPEPFSLAHAAVSRTPQVLTTGRSVAECALLKHCRTASLAKASLVTTSLGL